jgi:predicted  nucleic acid-binding Zn-ribbon protein
MSVMNNLDLKLKELETQIDQTKETIQSIRQLLSSNENESSNDDRQPKRNPVEDKVTVRKMLAKKSAEGYTKQVKELLQKFGAEKLSDVDPKDYEDLYYSAEGLGQ